MSGYLEIAIDPSKVGLQRMLPMEPNRWRTDDGAFNVIYIARAFHMYDRDWKFLCRCRSWFQVQIEMEARARYLEVSTTQE